LATFVLLPGVSGTARPPHFTAEVIQFTEDLVYLSLQLPKPLFSRWPALASGGPAGAARTAARLIAGTSSACWAARPAGAAGRRACAWRTVRPAATTARRALRAAGRRGGGTSSAWRTAWPAGTTARRTTRSCGAAGSSKQGAAIPPTGRTVTGSIANHIARPNLDAPDLAACAILDDDDQRPAVAARAPRAACAIDFET
jgi:hypothetical protein